MSRDKQQAAANGKNSHANSQESRPKDTRSKPKTTQPKPRSTRFFKKPSFKVRLPKSTSIFYPICIGLGVLFFTGAAVGIFYTTLLTFYRTAYLYLYFGFYSINTASTTGYSIGQICQYSNQCPENAYCSTTCKCPDNYYVDLTSGKCVITLTKDVACTYDYQCNKVSRLACVNGICNCENITQYWDSTYSVGGGVISGRCKNRQGQGQSCSATTQGIFYVAVGTKYGSTSSICYCDYSSGYKLNLNTGGCDTESYNSFCASSLECRSDKTFCMSVLGDGLPRCITYPTLFSFNGTYTAKADYGANCNYFYKCNEFKNLKCSNYYENITAYGTCACFNKYYYYNTSMCVYGNRYGEACTAASSCVPTTSGMICSAPFTGASYTVCRCASTQYYDYSTETCKTLKTFNTTCKDSTECSDAYPSGVNIQAYGYCGFAPGASIPTCLCINSAYSNAGAACAVKTSQTSANLQSNTAVACVSTNINQCYYNQYCSSSFCSCGTGKYRETNQICYYLKFSGNSCSNGYECWSGTCTSSACT